MPPSTVTSAALEASSMRSRGHLARRVSAAYSAFGLCISTDLELPGAWAASSLRTPFIDLQLANTEMIDTLWSGFDAIGWRGTVEGGDFSVQRGVAGDHLFVHDPAPEGRRLRRSERRAVHHLSPDPTILTCAPAQPDDPLWLRVVLDSVLFSIALIRGYEALHAGAISTPTGAVAITAPTGGGKSTLLAHLVDRGAELLADDVVVLKTPRGKPPLAYPGPPLMNLPASSASRLARATIACVEDERWVAVPVHPGPQPLKAVIVLDRKRESPELAAITKLSEPFVPLMQTLMAFPDSPGRGRKRFELASNLASDTALWQLTADLSTAPETLAELVLEAALGE